MAVCGSAVKSRTVAECQWYRRAIRVEAFMPCCTMAQSPSAVTTNEWR